MSLRILFICTGNICRSPTAERLAAMHSDRLGLTDVQFSSAGVAAVVGHPIHPEAARALRALGGEPDGFAARRITPKMAAAADLTLTMTSPHRDAVAELAPRRLRRIFTLAEAAALASRDDVRVIDDMADRRPHLRPRDGSDVVDPIGRDADVYDAVARRIDELLRPIVEWLGRSGH